MSLFTPREYLRYSRHIQLSQFGAAGQARLKQAKVLIVGCGGLGAPVALYLAGAGVGHISLVDADHVSITNLHRQIGFSECDIGHNKAQALKKRLNALNSDVEIEAVTSMLDDANAQALVKDKHLVIDCSDQFEVRCLINQHCLNQKTSWIYASAAQTSGQFALFVTDGPCFRCLFPEAPENAQDCNAAGVLGTVPGILGTLQADQALQYLAGALRATSQITMVETAPLTIQALSIRKRPDCPACSAAPKAPTEIKGTGDADGQAARNNACANEPVCDNSISCEELELLQQRARVALIDVRDYSEHHAFNIGGSNIPLQQLASNTDALRKILAEGLAIVCYCHSGKRSESAVKLLQAEDIDARSLENGLQAYLEQHS